jgi:predicted TIM-barrel fold metal-dependent hydrolase
MKNDIKSIKIHDGHVNLSETGKWFNTSLDASYEKIVDDLFEAGIDKSVLIAMPGACTNQAFEAPKIDRNKFWCFGNIDFSRIEYSLDQIKDLDLDGVKIHPRMQNVGLDALLGMNFLSVLEEAAIPVMICGWQQSSILPIDSLSPLLIDRIAKKHTQLPIIFSHMGGYRLWESFTVARSNPLVYLDCSYFLHIFTGTSLETDFFSCLKMIDQKVIYGSDFPEIPVKPYLDRFLLNIGELDYNKALNILSKNIEKLMNRSTHESSR